MKKAIQNMTKDKVNQNIFLSAWRRSFLLGCVFQRVIRIKLRGMIKKINMLNIFFITLIVAYKKELTRRFYH